MTPSDELALGCAGVCVVVLLVLVAALVAIAWGWQP